MSHVCQQCGCDVFTVKTTSSGYKIPECMGCGSDKPPINSGINREKNSPPPEDKRWNPKKAVDEYIGKAHWDKLRKEWLNEWNKRVGYTDKRHKRKRNGQRSY